MATPTRSMAYPPYTLSIANRVSKEGSGGLGSERQGGAHMVTKSGVVGVVSVLLFVGCGSTNPRSSAPESAVAFPAARTGDATVRATEARDRRERQRARTERKRREHEASVQRKREADARAQLEAEAAQRESQRREQLEVQAKQKAEAEYPKAESVQVTCKGHGPSLSCAAEAQRCMGHPNNGAPPRELPAYDCHEGATREGSEGERERQEQRLERVEHEAQCDTICKLAKQ
jgi:hypothetical protein